MISIQPLIERLERSEKFLEEENLRFGSGDFGQAVEDLRAAQVGLRMLWGRTEALERLNEELKGFERLLREMVAQVPGDVILATRTGKRIEEGIVPTATTSFVGVERFETILLQGTFISKVKDGLAWVMVRARDQVKRWDER